MIPTNAKLTQEHRDYLVSTETLQSWAGMSLKWRVSEFEHKYGIKINQFTLRNLYVKHRISYRNIGYMTYNGFKITHDEKRRYAMRLKEIIDSNQALIYVDESSFHTWKRSSKTWAPRHNIIHMPIANSRRAGVTVYGAIGSCLK